MKFYIWIFLLFCIPAFSFAQATIKGKVVDKENKSMDYYLIKIISQTDSAIVLSGSFVEDNFEFENLRNGDYILNISSMGYENASYPFSITDSTKIFNFPIIPLLHSSHRLNEVVVTGKAPLVVHEGNNAVVNIENSVLSDAGSINEMLSRTPGLVVDVKGQIAVMGKGNPIIYIDNKEVLNSEELTALQSSDISKVEIIRNPSSKYNASGRPVIIIKTKKAKKDNTMVQFNNKMTIARKISDRVGVQIAQNSGRYSGFYTYSYGDYRQKQYADYFQTKYNTDYTINNVSNDTEVFSNKDHSIFAGTDFQVRKNDYLGLKFTGDFSDNLGDKYKNQQISKSNYLNETSRYLYTGENINNNNYTVDLSYTINRDSANSLNINTSYAHKNYSEETNISETNLSSAETIESFIDSRNKYDVYYLAADYQFDILKTASQIGGKLSKIKNDGYSQNWDVNTNNLTSSDKNLTDETIYAAYFTLNKTVKKIKAEVGIRYEFSKSKIETNETSEINSYKSSKFFPNVNLNYVISPNLELNFNYNKSINRQTFSQINPNIVYLDSLSYLVGNSYLRPSYSDNVEIGFRLKNLNFTANMQRETNTIVYVGVNDEDNPDVTKFTFQNLDRAFYYNLGASYSLTKGNYSLDANYNILFPDMTIVYMDQEMKVQKAMSSFTLNNSYNLPNKSLTLFLDFSYRSSGNYQIQYFCGQSALNTGVRKSFLKDKLKLTMTMYDLFHKNSGGNYNTNYGNISEGMRINQDTRFFRINLSYTFNSLKTKIKAESASQSELERLK